MKTTIVTVTFNAHAALQQTLDNLASVRSRYDDYIVIDGGSSDGTQALLTDWARAGVVTQWISERDAGIYDAMNKGWCLAPPGSRILFLGAGDKVLGLPGRDVGGPLDILFGDVELEGRGVYRGRADGRLRLGNTLHHQALLIPKALHPAAPFDCEFSTYADFDFNQRLFRRGANFVRCDGLRGYAMSGGVSQKLGVDEMTAVCRKNFGHCWAAVARFYLGFQGMKAVLRPVS